MSLKKTENVAQGSRLFGSGRSGYAGDTCVDSFIDGNNNKVIDAGESFAVQFTVENQERAMLIISSPFRTAGI